MVIHDVIPHLGHSFGEEHNICWLKPLKTDEFSFFDYYFWTKLLQKK